MSDYTFTPEQIDAAWDYEVHKTVEIALRKLGIYECEECDGKGWVAEYGPCNTPCFDCNGHGWVIGDEDE
jgi:DnaJ-class molecular chaperone